MFHPETHKVTAEHGPRPAGSPDKCFYCGESVGSDHKSECVCRNRTVVMKVTLELPCVRPESWLPYEIERHFNDSSWCQSNLSGLIDDLRCLCGDAQFEYVREATIEDEYKLDPEEVEKSHDGIVIHQLSSEPSARPDSD